MKKCLTCNKEFPDNQFFCTNCGCKLADNSSASTGTSQTKTDSNSKVSSQTKTDSNSKPADQSKPVKQSKGLIVVPAALIVILSSVLFVTIIIAIVTWAEKDDYESRYYSIKLDLSNTRSKLEQAQSELAQAQSELKQAQSELKQAQSELKQTQSELRKAQNELFIAQIDWMEKQRELDKLSDLQGLYGYGSEKYYAEQSVVVLKENESKEVTIYCSIAGATISRNNSSYTGILSRWSDEGGHYSGGKAHITITGNLAGFYTIEFTNDKNSDSFEILVIVLE